MKIIGLIILGVAIIFGLISLFTSKEGDPKKRATETAAGAASGAFVAISVMLGIVFQILCAAIPIAVAILIVLWVLKGCS